MDTRKEGYRKEGFNAGGIHKRIDAAQEDTGQLGSTTGGMQDWRDAGLEGGRTGRMQELRDAGLEGCRKGGMHERRDV